MLEINRSNKLFHVYYKRWISIYKEGAIRNVTMKKYIMTHKWLTILAPTLRMFDLSRVVYQQWLLVYLASSKNGNEILRSIGIDPE